MKLLFLTSKKERKKKDKAQGCALLPQPFPSVCWRRDGTGVKADKPLCLYHFGMEKKLSFSEFFNKFTVILAPDSSKILIFQHSTNCLSPTSKTNLSSPASPISNLHIRVLFPPGSSPRDKSRRTAILQTLLI